MLDGDFDLLDEGQSSVKESGEGVQAAEDTMRVVRNHITGRAGTVRVRALLCICSCFDQGLRVDIEMVCGIGTLPQMTRLTVRMSCLHSKTVSRIDVGVPLGTTHYA